VDTSANYFREKAAQCRRLAATIINQNDPAVSNLMAMADEFASKAVAADAEAVETAVEKGAANASAPERPIAAMKPPGTDRSRD